MKSITLRYENESGRVTQTYWGSGSPKWVNNQPDGETVTSTEITQQARTDALNNAINSVEAGVDYDPSTETVVSKLYYNPDLDELYAQAEIQLLSDQP